MLEGACIPLEDSDTSPWWRAGFLCTCSFHFEMAEHNWTLTIIYRLHSAVYQECVEREILRISIICTPFVCFLLCWWILLVQNCVYCMSYYSARDRSLHVSNWFAFSIIITLLSKIASSFWKCFMQSLSVLGHMLHYVEKNQIVRRW